MTKNVNNDSLKLGRFGKVGKVQTGEIKGGLKKDQIDKKYEPIFNKFAGEDGILDADELKNFKDLVAKAAGNKTLSQREAGKFLKEHGLENVDRETLLSFIQGIQDASSNTESSTVNPDNGDIETKYKDGKKEVISKDGTIKNYDGDKLLDETRISKEDGSTTKITYQDNGKPGTTVITSKDNKTTSTIKHDSEGRPETKDVKSGLTEEHYTYDDSGKEQLTSKVLNKGIPSEEVTYTYKYNDNGKTETIKNPDGSLVENNFNKQGNKLSQTKTKDGVTYTAKYDGNKHTIVAAKENESIEDMAAQFGCTKEELLAANPDAKLTDVDGKQVFQKGATVKVPGEIEADAEALRNRPTIYDEPTQPTTPPAEPPAPVTPKTKTKTKTKSKTKPAPDPEAEAKKAAQEAQLKSLGLKNHNGQGSDIVGHLKGGKEIKLKQVGEAINGRKIATDGKGKYYVISHDGYILKNSYVSGTTQFAQGTKVNGKIKDKNGKLITKQFAVVPNTTKDKHGRSVVVDEKGNYYMRAADGTILKKSYLEKSDKADTIRTNAQVAQTETLSILDSQLKQATAAFDQQMKKDGWAGDVADAVSYLWNNPLGEKLGISTGNTASKVRKDLAKYKNDLASLRKAASKGEQAFATKFKEIYGITYDKNAVANYFLNPTAANYKKAFGTKNDIAQRVAKYNKSQDKGASAVKTTVVAAASTAAAFATGGLSIGATVAAVGGTTAAARLTTEVTDLATNEIDGDVNKDSLTRIGKQAVVEGAIAGITAGAMKGISRALTPKPAPTPGPTPPQPEAPLPALPEPAPTPALPKPTPTPTPQSNVPQLGYQPSSAGALPPPPQTGVVEAVTEQGAKKAAEEAATRAAEEAAQKAAKKAAEDAVKKAAEEATKKAEQEAAKKAAEAAAKKAAEEAAKKAEQEAAKKAAEEAAKRAAEEAAKKAATDATMQAAKGIGVKVAANGIRSLSTLEKSKLAELLGITPDKLGHLTKADYRKLIIQFHPDRNPGNALAEELSKIIANIGYVK